MVLTKEFNFNFLVVDVENGKEALQELQKEDAQFDLVLLDLYMPEMVSLLKRGFLLEKDGLEVLTSLNNDPRLSEIPVIIMSADHELESVAACLNNGAKDYLMKPVNYKVVKKENWPKWYRC